MEVWQLMTAEAVQQQLALAEPLATQPGEAQQHPARALAVRLVPARRKMPAAAQERLLAAAQEHLLAAAQEQLLAAEAVAQEPQQQQAEAAEAQRPARAMPAATARR